MINLQEIVFVENENVVTTSLKVAEVFSKEHKHVLDAIRDLQRGCADFSADPMFEEQTYISEQNGQSYPMFIMNRDGFTLLAMGFKGKKAMKFKLDYIKAFNAMEAELRKQKKPLTGAEYLLQQAQLMVEQERRLKNVESRIDKIERDKKENTEILLKLEVSTNPVPAKSLRAKINRLVRTYSESKGIDYRDIWKRVYQDLYDIYHINLKARKHGKGESNLDVAERIGCLDKIYDIVSSLL